MLRKSGCGIMLIILLMCILTLFLNIQLVKAARTIFIRPDGSVDPSTAPISSVDRITYIFTSDISDEIVVQRNNVIVDGDGYTLQGTGALNSAGIYLSRVSNVLIKKTNIVGFYSGIKLDWSANNGVTENNMTNNDFGIWLHESTNNAISRNNIKSGWCGTNLAWSAENSIFENNIENNEHGILLHWSVNNAISENNVTNNGCGISLAWSTDNEVTGNSVTNSLESGWYGIRLHGSAHNTIAGNRMANNFYGIRLLYESKRNTITGNNVSDNSYGITLWYSSNNTIYYNNFVDNTNQVSSYVSLNTWDKGYPSGGNYWNDYTGVDEKSGPSQDQSGSDGIGDIPYIIDADNRDSYPLMREIPPLTPPVNLTFFYALFIAAIAIASSVVFFMIWKRKKTSSAPSKALVIRWRALDLVVKGFLTNRLRNIFLSTKG